ncbi:MAG: (d)CMP kinase [Chitinophagales bacterium]|nr:(d)CMP kinase [Chitinophagaceae bacterium]MCB9064806.1 (d)CMP kinase [Chitinophagales bacterium]
MEEKIIIAIDGHSSCGKSTLAKDLAKELEYRHIDSGAMYRAITLYMLRNNVNITHEEEVKAALDSICLSFTTNEKTHRSEICLNGENVAHLIHDMIVADKVSDVAALKDVRHFAVKQQQDMGVDKGIVMDGRDIGTVVFPDAELKLFMTADMDVRAKRRFQEVYEKNPNITYEEVMANIQMRDYIDSNREESPLTQAADAVVLNNSHMTREEQLKTAMGWVHERVAKMAVS